MQTTDVQNPGTPRLPTRTTPGTPSTYPRETAPRLPGLPGPGLPDYAQMNTRAQQMNVTPYNQADIRRAGSRAATQGNAVARNQMAQFLARGGSLGSGAAALLGGGLYGAAAMAGLDAERGMDMENRKATIEGEFRRSDLLAQIAAMQQAAALGTTSLNQRAVESDRNFDFNAYASDRDYGMRERQFASDEAERRRRAEQDRWRFQNEQREYTMNQPIRDMNRATQFNEMRDAFAPQTNNSSNARWAADQYSFRY